ncbi:unnamed protein product [Plutella xylostella]|uniref:(diamondback moth) hypothetical protein n=1 Tax=Plutella xylostella TaxID=51655 RepID=A0A8S4CXM0_PLUXY|nr:unnamed protein product [Plutella xylostella]
MRLKYSKTLIEAQENESPIADISWSPNSTKLAVATSDRLIMLFDREGVRRDKFNTKPADPAAGKKSYVITSLSFSENSELLGVAQSDHMVFVYRVGADWSGKKVICNKFPLSGAPTQLLPAELGFYAGTTDGKVRILDCKTNKSTSLWTSGSCCVALARGGGRDGSAPLASGHVDGTIYLNGRLLLRYALPPTALALTPPYLIVGSCDGRVSVYEAQRGALLRSLEPPLPADCRDLISAVPSPSGQIIAFGIFDGCLLGEVKDSGVLELTMLKIDKLWAARALAWSGDGTRLALAAQSGALLQLEAVLRRWVWRDTVEVQHLSPRQLVLTRCAHDAPPLTVTTTLAQDIHNVKFIDAGCVTRWRCAHDAPPLTVTTTLAQDIHNVKFIDAGCVTRWRCAHDAPPLTVTTTLAQDIHNVKFIDAGCVTRWRCAHDAPPLTVTTTLAQDIHNVKFIGNDWYAVCRTSSSLILCDIARGLTSEIPWSGSGQRIYAAVGGACLLHRAGELSVVEYGLDRVLHTVRTERVNPHVLSVRINEARAHDDVTERKHLAYLLDRQTVAVLDLVTGIQVGQWWHEARVDWLELNESGQLLLMRDTRRRLALLNLRTGDKWWHEARVDWLELNESGQLLLMRDTRRRLALLNLRTGDKVV